MKAARVRVCVRSARYKFHNTFHHHTPAAVDGLNGVLQSNCHYDTKDHQHGSVRGLLGDKGAGVMADESWRDGWVRGGRMGKGTCGVQFMWNGKGRSARHSGASSGY